MDGDDDLAAIRAKRMAELRGSAAESGGGAGGALPPGLTPAKASADDAEKLAQMDEMRRTMLIQLLDNSARERLARISIVKPEKARAVEDLLIRMAQSGQLRGKVNENMLIDLLEQLNEQQAAKVESKIKVRKRWGFAACFTWGYADYFCNCRLRDVP
ncbi:PDCD5-related protein [Chytriomyces sp. MP71]|nr:PDCD5-related protein [Chytriomyces sp. MP71]